MGESYDRGALGCSLLPRGLGSRRDFAWKKREERLLLVGLEKVPHGYGLTGDHGSNTADGARTEMLPEPLTSTSFPEIRYPGLSKGEKEGLCASVGILKDFSIFNEDIKSV